MLEFTADLKWVAIFLRYGTQVFEKREAFDQQTYSRKIRDMLDQHLDATGFSVTVKLRHITDPRVLGRFRDRGEDRERSQDGGNPQDHGTAQGGLPSGWREPSPVRQVLRPPPGIAGKTRRAQMSWADKLKMAEDLAKDLDAEAKAHEGTGLSAGHMAS